MAAISGAGSQAVDCCFELTVVTSPFLTSHGSLSWCAPWLLAYVLQLLWPLGSLLFPPPDRLVTPSKVTPQKRSFIISSSFHLFADFVLAFVYHVPDNLVLTRPHINVSIVPLIIYCRFSVRSVATSPPIASPLFSPRIQCHALVWEGGKVVKKWPLKSHLRFQCRLLTLSLHEAPDGPPWRDAWRTWGRQPCPSLALVSPFLLFSFPTMHFSNCATGVQEWEGHDYFRVNCKPRGCWLPLRSRHWLFFFLCLCFFLLVYV